MSWTIEIENIAGIRHGEAAIDPGLNVVRGSNWQGKTSFIAALETALGTATPLTEGASKGSVTLRSADREVSIDLTRENGTIARRGEPLLQDDYDVDRAALFACLGEDNPIRTAVRRGENLEAPLTRPLEFQNLDERIAELTDERSRVESALTGAEEAAKRLPQVESRIDELEDTIAELREQLPDDGDEPAADREALSQARADRNRVRTRVERLESSIDRVESTLEDRRAELAALETPESDDDPPKPAPVREELAALRRDVDLLQSVYSANRLVLEEDRLDLVTDVDRELTGETVTCWICGTETDRDAVESHIEGLGDEVNSHRAQIDRVKDRVERLEAKLEQRQQAERRRASLEDDIAELEATLDERQAELAEARERLATLDDRVETLSSSVEASVEAVAELESEIKYRQTELEEARQERETLAERAGRVDALQARRDDLADEIESLRTRKADVKERTRRAFDAAIDDVLDRFDTGFEQARLTPSFDLVVARDGREASLDALSEGELELLGFVAALAGYEAYEVADCVPVLLVDDTGSLADANRQRLVEYLADRADYLVFTAHPEDTAVTAHEIDPERWTVVSDTPSRPNGP